MTAVASRASVLGAATGEPDGQVVVLLTAILAELQVIRAALTYEDQRCDHPKDQRLEMSAMGVEEWRCKACGFHYTEDARREERS